VADIQSVSDGKWRRREPSGPHRSAGRGSGTSRLAASTGRGASRGARALPAGCAPAVPGRPRSYRIVYTVARVLLHGICGAATVASGRWPTTSANDPSTAVLDAFSASPRS
jgi:hypothetical protein